MAVASLSTSNDLPATVLGVDLDELTLAKVESALRPTELGFAVASRRDAVTRAKEIEGRVVVLVDWSEDRERDRQDLCEAIRRATRPDRCYIVALGGPSDHSAISRAMSGAANDVLTRPFGDGMLLGRLRKGVRAMEGSLSPASVRAALDEAVRDHRTGEIVIRSGENVAFIHLQDGQIVWAHVSFLPTTMEDVARRAGAALDPDLVADVREECRAIGGNFLDVLVRWGVIEEGRAKQALREMIGERVKVAVEMPHAVALFVPRNRHPSGAFRMRTSEIPSLQGPSVQPASQSSPGVPIGAQAAVASAREPLPEEGAPSASVASPAEAGWFVHEAMKTEGALCAAVLDRRSGACLFHVGAQMNAAIAWSLVSALAALGPGADEVIAVLGEQCFVTRPLRHAPSCALFVSLSSSSTTLGFARFAIARIAGTRVSVTPIPERPGIGPAAPSDRRRAPAPSEPPRTLRSPNTSRPF